MPRVVGVVDADVALAEEQRLGIAVVLHRLVEVKVILREVREDADGVLDPVHAVELERVGRNLHHRVRAARVRHAAQQPLQLEGFRRRALGVDHLAADHVLDGADQADLRPGLLLEDALDEVGRGRLAARAGHADHRQLARGVAVPVRADHGQRAARGRDHGVGQAALDLMLADSADRALLLRHGDISVPVGLHTGDRHKEVAGLCRARVIADAGDLLFRVGIAAQKLQPREQILQFHRFRLL